MEEIKHGHWEKGENGCSICSVCKRKALRYRKWENYPEITHECESPYCAFCGAKMDDCIFEKHGYYVNEAGLKDGWMCSSCETTFWRTEKSGKCPICGAILDGEEVTLHIY